MIVRVVFLSLLVAALLPVDAQAQETVTVPFTTVSDGTTGGVLTSNSYTGIVTITVSGTGWARNSNLSDAFWVFTGPGAIFYNPSWYHLRIGTDHPVSQLGGSPPPYTSSHVYTFQWNVGASPEQLRFWVSDGVFSDNGGSYTITVTGSNTDPTADAGGPYTTDEGVAVTLDGSGSSDTDGTIVAWARDCEDDGAVDGTTATQSCTYDDDGSYAARLTVTDDDGATAEATATVTVANLAPTVTSLNVPQDIDEGETVGFGATGTDPGPVDTLAWTWSWGDSTANSTGDTPSHAFADDGSYTVTATAHDGDGGSDSSTATVPVNNVAPSITSTAPANVLEGSAWQYLPTVTDPGVLDVMTWSVSASAPGSLTLDTATGQLGWTPSYAEALASPIALTLFVDDGDGGTDAQSIAVTISTLDLDSDGVDDTWETANGLDPTDPTDAAEDPDSDGLDNLDEFLAGTDPNAFGGPDAPTPSSPVSGAEAVAAPDLIVGNATDPDGDALLYTWEVYSDAALSTLVTDIDGIPEDISGQTTWKVDLSLSENTPYWWRARASDPFVDSAWSVTADFLVNETNEPPTAPTPATPFEGETVDSLTPALQFGPSTDPDGDVLTYTIELWGDASMTSLLTSTSGLAESTGLVEWTVDISLIEDSWAWLRARATDEHGLDGPWSILVSFQASNDEGAPTGIVWIDPVDGDLVQTRSPTLVATGAVDPEGAAVVYEFEVANDGSWTTSWVSPAISAEGDGNARWDLNVDSIELAENNDAFARVRAGDGVVWSGWELIGFFVDSVDEVPGVPVLIAPADTTDVGDERPVDLIAAWTADADRSVLDYEFVVARDEALTDVVASVAIEGGNTVVDGAGEASWPLFETLEPGTFWWSAQAVDDTGLEGGFAAPWTIVVPEGEVISEPDMGDDDGDERPECGCATSGSRLPGASWLILATLVPLLRRRRVRCP
jgi:PKD repeat protein